MGNDILLDAGLFIGALLKNDPRHALARRVVNNARMGSFSAVTTVGILSETYAALTWERALPPHTPEVAVESVLSITRGPSKIRLLAETPAVLSRMLEIAKEHELRARRVHDARHAATALVHGVLRVATYDTNDWERFATHGISIIAPESLVSCEDANAG